MSANRIETRRRSATGASVAAVMGRFAAGWGGADASASAANAVPHSLQNFPVPTRAAPHARQASVRRVPQLMQNLAPAGFSSWQLGHVTGGGYSFWPSAVDVSQVTPP